MSKLEMLMATEGMDLEEMIEVYGHDSVVPGICMNPGCDYTTSVEPDCTTGECEECKTPTVKAFHQLLGVI